MLLNDHKNSIFPKKNFWLEGGEGSLFLENDMDFILYF